MTRHRFEIRPARPEERDEMFDIWHRAVRATHTFVSREDLESFIPIVRDYLASGATEFWVVCAGHGAVIGFMGLAGCRIESLFIAPELHGAGAGRALVEHARARRGELTVDVNEQNTGACRFYAACGFVVEGRSAMDETGRPYPLLHMRLRAPEPPGSASRAK